VSGRVVLASEKPVRATKEEAVVVGELGMAEAPKAFKGILIELAREDEIIRTMTDEEGKFAFKDIRPARGSLRPTTTTYQPIITFQILR